MRRAIGKKAAYLATVALLVALVATSGMAGWGSGGSALVAGNHATLNHAVPQAVPVRHSAPHPLAGEPNAVVSFTTEISGYIHMPFTVTFGAVLTNVTTVHYAGQTNTWVNLEVRDVSSVCTGSYGRHHPCPTVVNISMNDTVTNGSTSWTTVLTTDSLMLSQGHVTCPNAPCAYASTLPNDQYQLFGWVTLNNSVANMSFNSEKTGYLISYEPSATLLAPGSASVSTGNVSVAATYTGSYVGGVTVTIYSGTTASGSVVFTQGLFAPGAGAHTVVAASPWYVATAGSYYAVINITTAFGSTTFGTPVTVVPAGWTVYQNTSSWQNSSIWGGMSPGVVAALLLVVGLVIGMIVALALGRSMWGSPKPSPAQAWQSKPTNECSVCHQTFATEAELKDHQKTAHGM